MQLQLPEQKIHTQKTNNDKTTQKTMHYFNMRNQLLERKHFDFRQYHTEILFAWPCLLHAFVLYVSLNFSQHMSTTSQLCTFVWNKLYSYQILVVQVKLSEGDKFQCRLSMCFLSSSHWQCQGPDTLSDSVIHPIIATGTQWNGPMKLSIIYEYLPTRMTEPDERIRVLNSLHVRPVTVWTQCP